MADERTYIKVHDGMPEHPKIGRVGGDAAWLNVCAIAYCSRNTTDGHFPISVVPRLSDRKTPVKLAEKLVAAGVWHDRVRTCGACPTAAADEYVIHDYLEHQRSAAQIEELRQKRRASGSKGGRARAQANAQASATANAQANSQADSSTVQPETEEFFQNSQTEPSEPTVPRTPTAQTLLAEWIDHCTGAIPSRVKGQVAKHLRELLDDGIPYPVVRRGLQNWHESRKHAALLPSFVHEASQGPAAQPQQLNRAEQRTARNLTVVANLEAQEHREIS